MREQVIASSVPEHVLSKHKGMGSNLCNNNNTIAKLYTVFTYEISSKLKVIISRLFTFSNV